MIKSNSNESVKSAGNSWMPLFCAAGLMVLLCFSAVNLDHSQAFPLMPAGPIWLILSYALIWAMGIVLLLLAPRIFSKITFITITVSLAFICRLVMIPGFANDAVPSFTAETFHSLNLLYHVISYILPSGATPSILRSLYILFDMGVLCLLFILLSHRNLNLRWGILYAFSPVILFSISIQGLNDVSAIFFLMATICFYDKKKWSLMYLFSGLAVQAHPVSILTVPFFIRRDNWKFIWIAVLLVLPLMWRIISGETANPYGAFGAGYDSVFNSPVASIIGYVFNTRYPAAATSLSILLVFAVIGYKLFSPRKSQRHLNDPVSGCFFVLGAWILLSPKIYLLHLIWIVPFLVLRPTVSWMFLCLSISATFLANPASQRAGSWQLSGWAHLLEWTPFYLLLLHKLYQSIGRMRVLVDSTPPKSVSVVIPVINESEQIKACIDAIQKDPVVEEIVVVDGGSTDGTDKAAKSVGAKVIRFQPSTESGFGRGGQIDAGIRAATGDVVAIIHADTMVTDRLLENTVKLLQKQPMIAGGAVGSVFDGAGWRYRLLELANDFRMTCLGISFGDQIQFFRRRPVIHTKLFPNIPLMEDVEFSIRLYRLGRQAYLFGNAKVSTRKWQSKGFGHASTVIGLVTAYLWKRLWGIPDTFRMYRKYYGKSASID